MIKFIYDNAKIQVLALYFLSSTMVIILVFSLRIKLIFAQNLIQLIN